MQRISLIALALLAACVAPQQKESAGGKDSVSVHADIPEGDPMPGPVEIVADYERETKDTLKIDTTLQRDGHNLHVQWQHYSLRDSALHLPDRYTEALHLENYVAHNFVSALKIEKDGVKVIDTLIRKEMLSAKMQPVLNKYAALLYPNIDFLEDGLAVRYSVSIPLTDVGESHTVFCSYTGELDVE